MSSVCGINIAARNKLSAASNNGDLASRGVATAA